MKIFTLIVLLNLISINLFSQTKSSLRIIDLVVLQVGGIDSLSRPADTSKLYFDVTFKVNHPDSVSKVYYILGNKTDTSFSLNFQFNMKSKNNKILIEGEEDYAIGKYTIYNRIAVPKKKIAKLSYLELYIKDKNNKFSNLYKFNL